VDSRNGEETDGARTESGSRMGKETSRKGESTMSSYEEHAKNCDFCKGVEEFMKAGKPYVFKPEMFGGLNMSPRLDVPRASQIHPRNGLRDFRKWARTHLTTSGKIKVKVPEPVTLEVDSDAN
jgi:hypothetical protein